MAVHVRKRQKANLALQPKEPLEVPQAVAALKKYKAPKFDQAVNVCMHLGVDTAQAEQNLRGSIALPKGIGKTKRVIAFCTSDMVAKALEAGAIKAGGEELVAEGNVAHDRVGNSVVYTGQTTEQPGQKWIHAKGRKQKERKYPQGARQ